jgi:hypothetical protein
MWCRTVRKLIGEFVEGGLDTRRESRLRAHLDRCPACADAEADIRLACAALAEWRDVPPPEDGLHRLETRLAFAPPRFAPAPRGTLRQLVVPYVAGIATAASIMLVLWRPWADVVPEAGTAPAEDAVVAADEPPELLPGERELNYVTDDGRLYRLEFEYGPDDPRWRRSERIRGREIGGTGRPDAASMEIR